MSKSKPLAICPKCGAKCEHITRDYQVRIANEMETEYADGVKCTKCDYEALDFEGQNYQIALELGADIQSLMDQE